MQARKQFRAQKNQSISDADASEKPVSSGDKAKDKQLTLELAEQIAEYQNQLYAQHSGKLLVILQGMDTSGKDGATSGVFGRIDRIGIRCIGFKAPTQTELAHDYLWRIHQQVPGRGEIVIFNRSQYEDVLITKVHGMIDSQQCKQRYGQINDFERMLSETGTTIVKFFLHISKEEQKKRLEERLADPDKHWKFDPNDLKEREYWDDYQAAYQEAIRNTDTDHAPWYVIPADSKTHRNLAIASIMIEVLKDMKLAYPPAHPEYASLKVS